VWVPHGGGEKSEARNLSHAYQQAERELITAGKLAVGG